MADAAQQNELALRQAAYDQGLGQANTMYAGQQNMAAMLEQNPAQMAAILSGGQAADLGYQGIINPALQNMAQGSVGAAQQQWAPIQNFYDILGSNNWGGESTRTGRTVEDAFMSSNSKTDVRAAGNEVGRTKESGSDFGFNLGNFFSF